MSNWSFVAASYALTWVVFAGYAVFVARQVSRARAAYESGATAADGAP
jgi:hypothetical protein